MELRDKAYAAMGWIIGGLVIFMALPMFFVSFMSGLFCLAIALLLIPPARSYVVSITKMPLSPKATAIAIIVLGILSGYFSITASDKADKENAVIEAQKQSDNASAIKQKNANYFNQNSASILTQVEKLIDEKNSRGAISVSSKYLSSKNVELKKLYDKAIEMDRKEKTEQVLAEIAKTPESDLTKLAELHAQLVSINPQVSNYQEQHQAILGKIEWNKNKDLAAQQLAKQEQASELNMFGEQPVFLRWNGSYQEVTSYLKEVANDPDSIEIDGCTEVSRTDKGWLVGCNYRGKNAFNAVVKKSNWFTIVHGRVIAMHEYSEYKR